MKVVSNMDQNMKKPNMDGTDEVKAENGSVSFDDIVERWVYEMMRKDEKDPHPFDSAA
jgi:hypothetical protein